MVMEDAITLEQSTGITIHTVSVMVTLAEVITQVEYATILFKATLQQQRFPTDRGEAIVSVEIAIDSGGQIMM